MYMYMYVPFHTCAHLCTYNQCYPQDKYYGWETVSVGHYVWSTLCYKCFSAKTSKLKAERAILKDRGTPWYHPLRETMVIMIICIKCVSNKYFKSNGKDISTMI